MIDRRRLALAAIGLVISIAAVVLLTRFVDIEASLTVLQRASPLPIVFAITIVGGQLLLRAVRWSWILPTAGAGRIKATRLIPVLLVGYLGNTLLPARLGDGLRAYVVARREGLAVSAALGSVLLERVLDLATLAMIGWVAAVLVRAPLWVTTGTGAVAAVGVCVTLALVFIEFGRIVTWAKGRLKSQSRLVELLAGAVARFMEAAGGQPRRVIALAAAISAACWLLEGTTFWLVSEAVAAPIPWPSCLLIAAVTVLGTALPSAPGFVGTYELAAVAAGTALGYPAENVLAIAVLTHAVTTLALALPGVAALFVVPLPSRGGFTPRPMHGLPFRQRTWAQDDRERE